MRKLLFGLSILVISLATSFQPVEGDEILLKNGNKIDYGYTWEKNEMVWFYFHDHGVVGITKSAIVDKKGFLGTTEDNTFISKEYNSKISIPEGWNATNAVEALDFMPMEENTREKYKKLEPREIMKKMGFLVILFQGESWDSTKYNPKIVIKIEDQEKYPDVKAPSDYLEKSGFLLKTIYKNFKYSKKPQSFVLNDIPSAKQKFSCDMIVNNKPLHITQWQYALIRDKKIYLVTALNTDKNFKETEKLFLKTIKSFQFIDRP